MTPKASADEDDRAYRFDTTMEKDMELNATIGKGVVGVPTMKFPGDSEGEEGRNAGQICTVVWGWG